MAMTEPVSLRDAAVDYASRGWRVFPLKPASKEPHNFDGFKSATVDADFVSRWWEENPDDNIGIAANDTELYVLDVDGPDGDASLLALEEKYGALPLTLVAVTGKGKHYFFTYDGPEKLGNTASKLGKGIDTRGTGGYIVAPPSIHPDGRRYRWLNQGTPVAALPSWVVVKLKEQSVTYQQPSSRYSVNKEPQVRRAWETVCLELAQSVEGQRNQMLNQAAFTMGGWIATGHIARQEVESGLRIIGLQVGLTESEIMKTLESGITSGLQYPLYPKEEVLHYETSEQAKARQTKGAVQIARGSSFTRSTVRFFWNNRIPLGKLTILAGPGGVGKSFLTLALTAHITNGAVLLDTNGQTLDGEALFCSYEDDVEDTIGPRADRLGVDLDRCHFITGVGTHHGERDFGPQDVPVIVDYLKQCPNIKLIVIDPLGSFMGGAADMNAENQTRAVLSTLTKTAQETGTGIVVVAHLRKSLDQDDPIHRISGSVGITNISRSVLMVERDKDNPLIRWVKHAKSNFTRPAPDISYTFDDDGFKWNRVNWSAEDNARWLRITLDTAGGVMPMLKVFERAAMYGRTEDDLQAGRIQLAVEGRPVNEVQGDNEWLWALT